MLDAIEQPYGSQVVFLAIVSASLKHGQKRLLVGSWTNRSIAFIGRIKGSYD